MATLAERAKAIAQTLIVAAGTMHAVNATDIRAAAAQLHRDYADWSEQDIKVRISNEIKQSHSPGISGSI